MRGMRFDYSDDELTRYNISVLHATLVLQRVFRRRRVMRNLRKMMENAAAEGRLPSASSAPRPNFVVPLPSGAEPVAAQPAKPTEAKPAPSVKFAEDAAAPPPEAKDGPR